MSLPPRTVFTSALCYRDTEAALVWLESAFGFEPAMIIRDGEGFLYVPRPQQFS